MDTTRLETCTSDSRRVAVWRTAAEPTAPRGPIAVVAPGFTKTMAELSTVALTLAANGATVYRFDLVDHHGLSEGEIADFTLTGARRCQEAVLDLVAEREGAEQPVVLVALSLSGRAALRAAAHPSVTRLVTVVGVVHLRATLAAVFGAPLVEAPAEEMPATVSYGTSTVRTQPMLEDEAAHDWWSFESTVADLRALRIPVTAVHATRDPLVAAGDVAAALAAAGGRARDLVAVAVDTTAHDLGEDVPAALTALGHVARAACGPEAAVPDLDIVVAAMVEEQAWAASELVGAEA